MLSNNDFHILRLVFDANPVHLPYYEFEHELEWANLEQAFKDTFYAKFGAAGLYIANELYNTITDKYSAWELESFARSYRNSRAA